MRKMLWYCLLLNLLLLSATGLALHKAYLANYYEVVLHNGDTMTIYLAEDGTLMALPHILNKEVAHICFAKWSFKQDEQKLRITNAGDCPTFNGHYSVSRTHKGLHLKDGIRSHTFYYLNQK